MSAAYMTNHPRWVYSVPAPEEQHLRDEVFTRMAEDGLLATAMSAHAAPDLALWREITRPEKAWLLRCDLLPAQDAPPSPSDTLLGAALFTPWRGRLWEFDFMVRRAHFAQTEALAHGAFDWLWNNAPCDGIFGITPVSFRHARQWISAVGFAEVGRLPAACWLARRGRAVDGVLVSARRPAASPCL